jgi:hypothetical protein
MARKKRIYPVAHSWYAKAVRYDAQGYSLQAIAFKLGKKESDVLAALDFMAERYKDALNLRGASNLVAQQAVALRLSMVALTSLLKTKGLDGPKPGDRIAAIRLLEELREKWLNLIATMGIVKIEKVTLFEQVTKGLSEREKRKLVKVAYERINELERQEEAAEKAAGAARMAQDGQGNAE